MEIGNVRPIAIEEEMRNSYLDYAMSVIVSRALPDVRDGLKPVHRRILVTLHDLGLNHTAHYRKSAKICGDVSGNYHPHGEAIVYPSMARLAQSFNMRYPLVDGQGNFGSIDGDNPAAMRYTEARMTAIAEEMLADIDKDTVDWVDNYDSTRKEPVVLPARIPNLLINGSAGIAVGMATNIPPHNLGEICDAIVHMIDRYGACVEAGVPFDIMWARVHNVDPDPKALKAALEKPSPTMRQKIGGPAGSGRKPITVETYLPVVDDLVDIAPDELLNIVKGPDFPTAGLILGLDGIKSAYTTGHGRVVLRARAYIEDMRGSRDQIVVTELPYQVNKAALLEKIADLVRDRRLEGISDLRDESDRHGMRIVIELKRDVKPRQILHALYKHTAMQTAFSVNMLALVDNQPRTLTLKAALQHFIDHRQVVVTRRTKFDLEKARHRAHILEGLKIALDHLDEVIATIRKSRDSDTARRNLMRGFSLTEVQAQAILDMQLRRLAALERQKILDELAEVRKLVAYLEDLLANPLKILYLIRDELNAIKRKYGDERRTRILEDEPTEISEEDLIPDQEVVVGLTARGYVRRLPVEVYRPQRRARGAGTGAIVTREDDAVTHLMIANTRDHALFFTNRGRVYQMRVNDIPDATRQSRGLPVGNFVSIESQEAVTTLIRVRRFEKGSYFVMLTKAGEIKRIEATEFASVRSNGLIAMNLAEGDELRWVRMTTGEDEIIIATERGQCIRYSEKEIRATGRNSGGVRGVRLAAGDHTAGLDVVGRGTDLLSASERGFVKRTALSEYQAQGRGGGGVRGARLTDKTGLIVAARVVRPSDEIMVATADGVVYRSVVSAVPRVGRPTSGIGLVRVAPGDHVVSVACLYGVEGEGGTPAERRPRGGKSSGGGEQPALPDAGKAGGPSAGAPSAAPASVPAESGGSAAQASQKAPAEKKGAASSLAKAKAAPGKAAPATAGVAKAKPAPAPLQAAPAGAGKSSVSEKRGAAATKGKAAEEKPTARKRVGAPEPVGAGAAARSPRGSARTAPVQSKSERGRRA